MPLKPSPSPFNNLKVNFTSSTQSVIISEFWLVYSQLLEMKLKWHWEKSNSFVCFYKEAKMHSPCRLTMKNTSTQVPLIIMEGLYSLEALWWMVLHHMSVVVLSSCLSYPLCDRTTAVGSSRSCLVFCSWKSDCANLYGPLKYCLSYIQQNKSPRVIFEEANLHFKIGFFQNIGFFVKGHRTQWDLCRTSFWK